MTKKNGQSILILLCFLVYTISYLLRYSYSSNIVGITFFYGISKTEAGLVGTFYFVAYGASQFLHGALASKYNKKIMIPLVLTLSSILNIILFLKIDFAWFKYLWALNGFLNSLLWPSVLDLLSRHLEAAMMKKAIFFMAITVALGTCIVYGLSALFNLYGSFQYTFLVSAILGFAISVAWFFAYSPTVSSCPQIEAKKKEEKEQPKEKKHKVELSIILLVFFVIITNLVKDGLTTWVPQILKDTFGYGDSLSIILSVALPGIAVFGTSFALWLNKYIKDYPVICGIMFTIASCALGIVLLSFKASLAVPMIICFALACLLGHGINSTITTIAPLQLRGKYDSGKLTGTLNGFAYVGSALSSFGLGLLVDNTGWDTSFIVLTALCLTCAFIALIFFIVKKKTLASSGYPTKRM